MAKLPVEKIRTDVLVIGGGGAGLMAALEARKMGADVTIVSKSKVGRSGNTIIAGTGMAILAPDPDAKDSFEIFRSDTLRSGKGVNDRDLVRLFLEGSPKIIETLISYGVVLRKQGDRWMRKQAPGHSVPRTFTTDFSRYPYLSRGLSLTEPLLASAQKSGVRIVDFTPVVRLLVSDGRVCGAAALDKKRKTAVLFQSKAVVLAAGGGGRVYSRSNNTFDITGDAYALAYQAGATLRDMEFVQFYPTMMFSPLKVTISSPLFGEGAFLRNARGERFMETYDPAGDMATRDIMTRAMFSEVMAGRGDRGNIFMDCRHLSKDMLTAKFAELLRLLAKAGIDPLRDLIPISPATHFFMGGVVIDRTCETPLPGLLACGETVGGLHGANRLGGNALSEMFVFGRIAGRSAAQAALRSAFADVPAVPPDSFGSGDISLPELRQRLRETTWKFLSIVRSREACEQALDELARISDAHRYAKIESVFDLVASYELKSMLTSAALIAKAANQRKESRGAHFRSDHPRTDDERYQGSFYLKRAGTETVFEYHPV